MNSLPEKPCSSEMVKPGCVYVVKNVKPSKSNVVFKTKSLIKPFSLPTNFLQNKSTNNKILTGIDVNLKRLSPNGNDISPQSSGKNINFNKKSESILKKKMEPTAVSAVPASESSSCSELNKVRMIPKKNFTIILPQNMYKDEAKKLSELHFKQVKLVNNKETQTTIYSLLSPDGQLMDTGLEPETLQLMPEQNTLTIDNQTTNQNRGALALPGTVKDPKLNSLQKTLFQSQLPKRNVHKTEHPGTSKHTEQLHPTSIFSTVSNVTVKPKINFVFPLKSTIDVNKQKCISQENCSNIVNASKQVVCEENIFNNIQLSSGGSVNTFCSNTKPATNQSNMLISSTQHDDLNKYGTDNFENLNDYNLQKTKNPLVMWPSKKPNSSMGVEDNILYYALKEMEMCSKENEYGNIPLQKAIFKNDKTLLNRQCIILKAVGSNYLNHQNQNLETALILAVKSNLDNFVATLLNYGANQNIVDKDGNTALHIAVSRRLLVITKLLLAAEGARDVINNYNDEGFAPIHIAAMNGFNEIVRYLVSEGADINKKDAKSGRTAYHHAIDLKKQDVVKVLEGLGCITSEPDFAGHLPLLEETICITKQTTLSKKNTEHKNKACANKVSNLEKTHFEKKRENVTPEINIIDDNETISVPTRKRQKIANLGTEVLSLSSEDSDDDCLVVHAKYRNTSSAASKRPTVSNIYFKPGPKRQSRRKLDQVFDVSSDDDDTNSNCEIIDYETPVCTDSCVVPVHSQTSIVTSNPVPEVEDSVSFFYGFSKKSCDQSEAHLTTMEMAIKKFINNSQIY